jgi:ubiquinone/menaquinone biosynthesis C-methylase UbiE
VAHSPDSELEARRAAEKAFHEELRAGGPLPDLSVERFRAEQLAPCYETGLQRSDNKRALLEQIQRDGGWQGKRVLDYACGNFDWGTFFAQSGAAHVSGFDLAESGIARARERVERMGLADRVDLAAMDASRLEYPDESFDLVVGIGVLHHVAKYPGVFEHLHRVLKPGASAYFLENLCDFPLWKLWWRVKGDVEEGDIPLYRKDLEVWTRAFSRVQIVGDSLFSTAKHLVWRPRPTGWRRGVLRGALATDEWLFRKLPGLRRWGSYSYLILTR